MNKRRPIRAVMCVLAGTPFALFAAMAFYFSRSDKTTVAYINSLFIGTLFSAAAIYLYWRAWVNFAGTWESRTINFNSPVGKAIAASALGAKGLSDLHILYSHPYFAWAGFGACAFAPAIVWLKTRRGLK